MADDKALPPTVGDIIASAARQGRAAAPTTAPRTAQLRAKPGGLSRQAQPPGLSETTLEELVQKVAQRASLDNEAALVKAAEDVGATTTNPPISRPVAMGANRAVPPVQPFTRWRAGATVLLCGAAAVCGWLARGKWSDMAAGTAPFASLTSEPLPAFPVKGAADVASQAPFVMPTPAVAATTKPERMWPVTEPLAVDASQQSHPVEAIAAPSAKAITLGFVTEPEIGGGAWLIDELARRMEGNSEVQMAPIMSTGWAASLVALKTQPRVSVVRYDALQAARRAGAVASIPALEIVAPLASEALYFIVRSDSSLRFIQDIRGHRINVGPARSSLALTAETAYRQMFDGLPSLSSISRLDDGVALELLRSHGALDVVVATSSGARGWLAALSAGEAENFRLLELDSEHPAGRKAVKFFLQTRVPAQSLGHFPVSDALTLSTMSFLVTARSRQPDNRRDHALAALAGALCRAPVAGSGLPTNITLGEPDVGWPYSMVGGAVLAHCERPGTLPAKGERTRPAAS